jgi:hypothetical protein
VGVAAVEAVAVAEAALEMIEVIAETDISDIEMSSPFFL